MPKRKFQSTSIRARYPKGQISVLGINSVYPRTPWVTAWWSAAFTGFGHMFIGKYLQGLVLILWELVVNNKAQLNMGIALSFQGRFEEAKAAIDQNWGLLYVAVYLFSIWDSYRCAVESAKSHVLSEVEDGPIMPSDVSFFDIVILDKKHPWVGMLWSFLSPGLGQLYSGSTVVGTFILAWWIFVCYKANAVIVCLYSFLGDFTSVAAAVDWQWFLFLPSMFVFAVYQAYASVNENNTLFDIEQTRYLRVRAERLKMTHVNPTGQIRCIATYEHSPFVEIVIHELELMGVPANHIVALPLENLEAQTHLIDSIHRVDGRSLLDGAMMCATVFAVLGVIYGFIWEWGPVIWGLIGMVSGFVLGLGIELAVSKHKKRLTAKKKAEVIVEFTCRAELEPQLVQLLKARKASGYVMYPMP